MCSFESIKETVMRTLVLTLWLLGLPLLAQAQTTTPAVVPGRSVLLFDHDGAGVDRWEMQIDATAWATVAPTKGASVTGTPLFVFSVPFPASLTQGNHIVKMRACNTAGCAESDPFGFAVVGVPARPIRLRATGE
jgi:hypothetical protein